MSAKSYKNNLIRQFSVDLSPQPKRIIGLKKQYSEDISLPKGKWNFKDRSRIFDERVVKEAWTEKCDGAGLANNFESDREGIVAKKCKETKRPSTEKFVSHTSLGDKGTLLLSHQELAERLRRALKERQNEKQNLDIFLNHSVKEKQDDLSCSNSELTETQRPNEKLKLILPLNPELATQDRLEINYKNIFQKRMRRSRTLDNTPKEIAFCPLKPPVMKRNLIETKEHENLTHEENPPINVVIRPMTADSRRKAFARRASSAFHGTNEINESKAEQRPPLVRSSSVPLKPAPPLKSKLTTHKRRIKSAPKKKETPVKEFKTGDALLSDENNDEDTNSKFQKCVSLSGAEIVTMVSLISPEESEIEEHAELEKVLPKLKVNSPTKASPIVRNEHPKNFTLRKAVKSVSFQQSSIHAVRSFSASFPARRSSMATALMLDNAASIAKTNTNMQEKRSTVETAPDDVREPKRRLLRTKSVPAEISLVLKKEDHNARGTFEINDMVDSVLESNTELDGHKDGSAKQLTIESDIDSTTIIVEFNTPKEKQCWEAYRKMSEKGINISFDTILRGMLTPTEYRLRRKSVAVIENLNVNPSPTISN